MWIGRLWPRRAKAPPSQPPAKAAASPRALSGAGGSGGWHTGYLDPRTFVAAVKQLLEQSRTLNPRLHVFSLADFRQAAGGKWDRIADMVTTVTESIIRRHLNPKTDIFTQIDAETSLLALPLSSRGDARTCVAAIARDLATHLFGDAVIAGRRPQVVAGNMAMEEAVTEDGDLDMGAVRRAVREAAPALAPDEPKWAVLTPPHRAELARLLLPEPPLGGGDVPEWAELHVHHQAAEAEVRPLLPTTTLGLVWRPAWVAAKAGIGAYVARVLRRDSDDEPALEGTEAYAGTAAMGALTLDRFVATAAMRELRELALRDPKAAMVVPVFWTSLASHWRGCLLAPLADSPAAARRRQLSVEIVGLPPDVPPTELRGLTEPLAALGCRLLVRLPLAQPHRAEALPMAAGFGVDLAELPEDERSGDDALFERLRAFRQTAGRPCHVWGCRRRPLIARLARDGFGMLNGPALMADLDRPGRRGA